MFVCANRNCQKSHSYFLTILIVEIRGRPPSERREVRQKRSRPMLDSLHRWMQECLPKLSRKSDTAAAVRYALGVWAALIGYCDDGRIWDGQIIGQRSICKRKNGKLSQRHERQ
jgi:Transposase IS66 family